MSEQDFSTEALAFTSAMTQLVVGPGEVLRDLLCAFCYLGPLREPPARKFVARTSSEPKSWANGAMSETSSWEANLDLTTPTATCWAIIQQ